MIGNIPSKSPAADSGDLGAAFEFIFNKLLQKTDGQLPAAVVSYDRVKNRAVVQPLLSIVSTNGQPHARAPVASVPVLALGGGGFFINFPLITGDIGWIEASDRDISLFLQNAQQTTPNDGRMHTFEAGRFIPDAYSRYTFSPDPTAMVISSLDGTTRIALSPGKIVLTASEIDINGTTLNVNVSGATTLNTATLGINTTGGSGSTVTGAVNLPVNTTIDGRPFMTHEHSGVQPGSGDTGGVV